MKLVNNLFNTGSARKSNGVLEVSHYTLIMPIIYLRINEDFFFYS